jgi:hypothetical protein
MPVPRLGTGQHIADDQDTIGTANIDRRLPRRVTYALSQGNEPGIVRQDIDRLIGYHRRQMRSTG